MDVWAIVVAAVVALLVGWLGAWATLRASSPKLKVNWWVRSNTPLINLQRRDEAIRVQLGHINLEKPRIVELVIANEGRRDITSAMFHDGRPFRFSFGVPVMAVLHSESGPAAGHHRFSSGYISLPGGRLQGESWVELAPTLLKRKQVVTATVLVDGDEAPVECRQDPLVDVDVVSEAPGRTWRVASVRLPFGVSINI